LVNAASSLFPTEYYLLQIISLVSSPFIESLYTQKQIEKSLLPQSAMSTDILSNNYEVMKPEEFLLSGAKVKNRIWSFGIPSWLFGITDRSFAAFADGHLSAIELLWLCIASFFLVGWLCLKPEESSSSSNTGVLQNYWPNLGSDQDEAYLRAAQSRMLELQGHHLISQDYILPVPYLCQIYHLLNLKHLEKVHGFSLNNLKIVEVSNFRPTTIGGIVKFKTILDSPINALRIWRKSIVEVGLTLHTPYTVELCVPVYNNKKITVIFNALPLNKAEHRLLIDIYSDLGWPKLFMQILLHLAACLTLFEDLPYLRKLSERKLHRSFSLSKVSDHETMWLFRRFVTLYSSSMEPSQPILIAETGSKL